MIIAIEGLDAAGKATQTAQLAQRFRDDTRFEEVATMSFPQYETETGRAISTHLKKEWTARRAVGYDPLDPIDFNYLNELVFQSLMAMDRYAKAEYIESFYRTDRVLILDRYFVSGIVYGSVGGLDDTWLWQIHSRLPKPHYQILLDISLEESIRRRPNRRDRIESNRPFLEKVRSAYLSVFHNEKPISPDCWHVVDGVATPQLVNDIIWDVVT